MLDIQNEFGGSNPISLSEYYGAASGVPTSGMISINDFRGKSAPIPYSIGSAVASGFYATNSANGWPEPYEFPQRIKISSDGTKFYLGNIDSIREGAMSTPFDINTGSYTGEGPVYYYALTSRNGAGFDFKSDGTKLYVILNGNNETPILYQYNLPSPWDVAGTAYNGGLSGISKSLRNGGIFLGGDDFKFKPDGTKMYALGRNSSYADKFVYQWNLGTPWDITTASYQTYIYVGTWGKGLDISDDGTKMLVMDDDAVVSQYNLSTPWSIASASSSGITFNADGIGSSGMSFGDGGTYMYVCTHYQRQIYRYTTVA